jgi:phytoene dehydrogenase-like protein
VTLLERSDHLGGALSPVRAGGFTWDAGPTATTLPAVVRDLFRKSGRPVERELDLEPLQVAREHRFEDGSTLAFPTGSRAAQLEALEELDPGLGGRWCEHVASYAPVWEALRRDLLERPWSDDLASRGSRELLRSRESLHRRLRRTFRDERLRVLAAHPFRFDGHETRNVPAWAGMHAYVEQRFGTWTVPGGMWRLADVLAQRLITRGVQVALGCEARDLLLRDGRVVAVDTDSGTVDADLVVCAVDPRRLPALASYVARTMPALPPVVAHLGLAGAEALPEMAREVVVHGEPTFVVRTSGTSPQGHAAWTVLGRGNLAEDLLRALARTGIDVREHVVERIDLSPRDLVQRWGGSPLGVLWQGRSTVTDRIGPRTPVPGVLVCGSHATSGAGLPYVGLSAALVAEAVGPG